MTKIKEYAMRKIHYSVLKIEMPNIFVFPTVRHTSCLEYEYEIRILISAH